MTITELWDDPVKLLKWCKGVDLSSVAPERLDKAFKKATGRDTEEYVDYIRQTVAAHGATHLLPKRQTYKQFLSECLSKGLGIRKGSIGHRQKRAAEMYPDMYNTDFEPESYEVEFG